MKYLSQFLILMGFTVAGEALQRLIPLPIPAAVYGLVLLFAALCTGLVKLSQVKAVGDFLISLLPLLFVSGAVGLAEQWELIAPVLLPVLVLIVSSTVLVFGISGCVTQRLLRKEEGEDE